MAHVAPTWAAPKSRHVALPCRSRLDCDEDDEDDEDDTDDQDDEDDEDDKNYLVIKVIL